MLTLTLKEASLASDEESSKRRLSSRSASGCLLVFYAGSKKRNKKKENGKEEIPTLEKMLTMPSTRSVCMSPGRKSKYRLIRDSLRTDVEMLKRLAGLE